ncbi:MAG: gliding motility lipoprotein GldH, partial [Muribaculaceae bacterium]|nr:gliding motility lipoprotein GldH [Muribaculaceae bacterium]
PLPAFTPVVAGIVFSFLSVSCSGLSHVDYSEFDNFSPEGIPPGWVAEFNPYPHDSLLAGSNLYDVVVMVRYNGRCSSREVIIDLEETSLDKMTPDSLRISMPLFNQGGKSLGKGNLGLYELTDTIRRGFHIPEGYTVAVTTPLSSEQTVGINAIGVKLVESGRRSLLDIERLK